ncbi:MAG TPA: 4-hydroxy-tetrahydrodipicolinate reductase [Alphaproteobacteria bacterium]|jgi:4-hydroxy-tetrahydrodipicolinate reductase|nr:4-hydroxy-tetrahydrodipicolinate reductase [Alphaproteobacteria bacterium]
MAETFCIGVVGAGGRMGRMLVAEIAGTAGCILAGATERAGSDVIGRDAGELAGLGALGVTVDTDAAALFAAADAVIDFTAPAASIAHAALAARHKKIHVVGTTGLEPKQEQALAEAARSTTIVWAPNMSLGVNLALALTERVARTLGPDWDIEIVEMHHRHKVDAPSGTALGLGRAAAAGRGVTLDAVSQRVRDGVTGPRRQGDIGFATLRGGDVVGEHSVIFAAEGERLEIVHKATSRRIFARGAVRAALWARGRAPGLYSMRDVLGLG